MLKRVFRALDEWVTRENATAAAEAMSLHRACTIRVFGQTALLEARVPWTLALTQDVDVYANYDWAVRSEFERLLKRRGKILDPLGHEAWMPEETVYRVLYSGRSVTGKLAEPDFVLLSKAHKAPAKNAALLTEYLASGATPRFLALARKYQVDLERFL